MTKVFMGIDPGSVATGWSVMGYDETVGDNHKNFLAYDSGVIKVPKSQKKSRRLFIMGKKISEVIYKHDNISEIYIEDIFVHRNAKSTMALAQVQGVIISRCYEASGIDPILIPPKEVRKILSGDGSLKKEEIANIVYKMTGYAVSNGNYDESDSMAVAIGGFMRDHGKVEKCQKSRKKQDWSHLAI